MEGIVVRRVIPSDNSCLFNAVGYASVYKPYIPSFIYAKGETCG